LVLLLLHSLRPLHVQVVEEVVRLVVVGAGREGVAFLEADGIRLVSEVRMVVAMDGRLLLLLLLMLLLLLLMLLKSGRNRRRSAIVKFIME
jgi:hypothetical protein